MKRYAKYKVSGISWIGEIPEKWSCLKIKRLFVENDEKNADGLFPLLSFSKNKGLVYFSENSEKDPSASDLTKYKVVHPGQLLENRMQAWHGMFICVDKDGCVSPDYSVFNPNLLTVGSVKYFEYCFRLPIWVQQFANESRGIGDGFNRLYTPQFHKIIALVPPPEEQKVIAEFLDNKTKQINELVSAKQKQIELLKEYKKAVIAKAVTQGINPKTKMKDSGISWIGQIPEHWDITRIRHIFEESDEKIEDNSGILLSLSQYTGISLKSDCEKTGMSEAESTEGYKIVHKGQFVMNIMLAWNGSYAVSDLEGIISPAYCVFNFITKCNQWYIHYLLRIKAYSGAFKTLSKGIIDSRLRLYPNKFYTFPVIVPPPEEQSQIVAFIKEKVSAIDSQIASVEKQIANLNEYKQSLISDVVTGKVKVA